MEAVLADQWTQAQFEHFSAYRQHESWTRPQLEEYQARALQDCRAYAYAHSPFYQRFHQGLMDRPLQDLPILTKAILMEHFDELVTDRSVHLHDVRQYLADANGSGLFLDRYQVKATSGSSGQPGIFLCDPTEAFGMTSTFTRCQVWGGVTPEDKAAVVASVAPAHVTAQFPIIINGQRVIPLQLSSNAQLETLVQRLNECQPDVLFVYASIGSTLAEEQRQGRLRIAPRSIFSSAEPLSSDMRRRIEETWQTKLFHVYGTSESGPLASECEFHQGMHLYEDLSIVEVVDRDNRPVPPGTQGAKVLLTVLFRRTQPLIRYEVSDLLRISEHSSCPCGRPFALLESIEGRTTELLYFTSVTGREEGVSPLQFQTVFDTLPISGWQVVQEQEGLHIFLTGASLELSDEHLQALLVKALTGRGVVVPTIEIHRVTALAQNASGKIPMVVSHIPRPTA
jgi:putative adenylate-forming enzyme